MASDGPEVSSGSTENQRIGCESLLTSTSLIDSPDLRAAGAETDRSNNTRKDTGESSEQNKDGLKVCQFFQKGKCHFGGRCRLPHSDPSPHDSAVLSPDMDDKQDEEKMEKHKKKKGAVGKVVKPNDNEGKDVNKKPRMRTADEVISRILWDTSVDASEFVVGYVDRFLGVLERPFCDFNWDTNPCDCDYTTELALPRHRIQYFAYRGHRVWDRHSRTDRVFGSTGQSLAPPFGKEEEVKDGSRVKDPEQQQDRGCETTEEQTGAVGGRDEDCARTKNRHVEEEELNEMNHTFVPTHCGGNTSQEQQDSHGLCVEEEAANRLQSPMEKNSSFQENDQDVSEEGEERHFEDWEETLEGDEDTQDPAPEQAEEKCDRRPPKKKPTHFITFRANTPTILSSFQQLQEELTALLPSSAPHWQSASKLHVTLCLLVLRGPAEVAAAAEILRRFTQLDRNPPVAVTFPVKLKHFNGRVLYLSPQPQLRLHQLNCGLQEAFRKEGWLHRSSYNPRYHLTLAKVEGADGERIFDGVWDLKVGKGLNFGRQPVNTLHLCTVSGAEVNGFYDIVCTVTLR
ncbi:leukocyte receptor cluster member 9 [Gambusia affinis]|uniref:leukocyte receptor cluster member 9 n=1 Tax=Gambusia affinis TaxID=33528 RepID=UPI001CDC3B7D|nr:leukocyte receptor cluster member 9 [Gambusia affinis]XP_043971852.1 leukocyte receptor cluster member 9 [Gambusia affinis]